MQQTTLDLFGQGREQWLEDARTTARKLLEKQPTITIEDVLRECPRPQYVHRNTAGQVFKTNDFKAVSIARSQRAVSKGRWIFRWALRGNHAD